MERERDELAAQLRATWEEEITAAGFVLSDAPTVGIAGLYHWQLAAAVQHACSEGMTPDRLLVAAEARLDRGAAGATRQRTPSRIALLRTIVQRLARLQTVDWRIAIDATLRGSLSVASEERRALLWQPVTARRSVPRLAD